MAAKRTYAKVSAGMVSVQAGTAMTGRAGSTPGSFMEFLQGRAGENEGTTEAGYIGNGRVERKSGFSREDGLEELRRQSLIYLLNAIHRLFHKREAVQMSADTIGFAGGMVSISEKSYVEEYEEMNFSAGGSVVTKDGRNIDFKLDVTMSRSFMRYFEKRTDIGGGPLIDPLVIGLDDIPAGLTDQKFYFDIDSDGEEDKISMPVGGGFLALDKNGDGLINNGSELFGTKSGDGFKDLAVYDEDGNGWIDEADPVFDRLKIWVAEADGSRSLYSLKDKDVGAVCLRSVDTEFSLNSLQDNSVKGKVAKSGVFLYESGRAGSIMHVDIAKRA